MMRITTWNVNGLRAAIRKGMAGHLATLRPDILLLQEIRATPNQLPADWRSPEGWNAVWHPGTVPGYAGVATWTRHPQWLVGLGTDAGPDLEGRILRTRTRTMQLINVYLPSGSRSDEAQARKEGWMADFAAWSAPLAQLPEPVLLCGDLNIAHHARDIHNPTGNKRNSGFMPHEREWFTEWLGQGWHDMLREHVGDVQGPYSWWSNRGQARAKDRGWRIDYVIGNAAARATLKKAWVHRPGGLEVSDHAPVTVELSLRAG